MPTLGDNEPDDFEDDFETVNNDTVISPAIAIVGSEVVSGPWVSTALQAMT